MPFRKTQREEWELDYMERYHQWLADPAIDEETKQELRSIASEEKEIKER